jgi:hypothetical protein
MAPGVFFFQHWLQQEEKGCGPLPLPSTSATKNKHIRAITHPLSSSYYSQSCEKKHKGGASHPSFSFYCCNECWEKKHEGGHFTPFFLIL